LVSVVQKIISISTWTPSQKQVVCPKASDLIRETSKELEPANHFGRVFIVALSGIADVLKSSYSQFGFRAAVATFAGTIPAFLATSWFFFNEYRGVWITSAVVLRMSPTTGASIKGLMETSLGTVGAGLLAMGVWYAVVGHIAGVLVLSFVAMVLCINNLDFLV
jgi:Fusaric acid resistance protein-like